MSNRHWTQYASDTISKSAQSVAKGIKDISETYPEATAYVTQQARAYAAERMVDAFGNAFGNAFNEFFGGGGGNGMRDEGPVRGARPRGPWDWIDPLAPPDDENALAVWQNNY